MRSILLVDDDIGALTSVELILDRAGYTVSTADSGEKALEWLETHTPDLIILDVVMPGLSGLDVCRRIRNDRNQYRSLTPIIMLTTRNSVRDIVDGDAAGSDLYLMKPILGTRLLKAVDLLLSGDIRRRPAAANRSEGNSQG